MSTEILSGERILRHYDRIEAAEVIIKALAALPK